MKSKKFFINVFSNVVVVLVIVSVLFVTVTNSQAYPTSGEGYCAIYNGNTENNNISLMINVYWGTEYVEPMLEVLKSNNVKCTFFVGGTWVNKNTKLLNKILKDGHEVGNHGYYHKDHTKITRERNREEIYITDEVVKSLASYEMNLFAPPSGAFDATTLEVASELGHKTIMWSKDTIDWRDKDRNLVYSRATNNAGNGDLVLMHPTQHTLDALDDIIKYYLANNLNVVTVSQNIAE
jgi:peptidoglycan/xylan/chitin deacetylase (PgdA/CDA1 family)